MFGAHTLIVNPTLVAAIAAACVGFAAFWSNPYRGMNRAFFSGSLHVTAWLISLHLALTVDDGLPWLRVSCAVGGWMPIHILVVQETIAARLGDTIHDWITRHKIWLTLSAFLGITPLSGAFIPSYSTAENRIHGWGYYAYIVLNLMLYGYLVRDALRRLKSLTGVKRLELQVWLGGGCVIGLTIFTLMALNAVTRDPVFVRLQPVLILVFYALTAFAITTHRIFDARQILLIALEKFVLIITIAFAAYVLDLGLGSVLPEPFGFVATTAVSLWLAVSLNGALNRIFRFYPEATAARQAAFAVARRESRVDSLEKAFSDILKGWGHTERAVIISGAKGLLKGGDVEVAEDSAAVRALRQLRWATPERLMRERSSPERRALASLLDQHGLGAVVIGEGPTLTALVGVGTVASRRPFTYPQITQLLELASIIGGALERAHFSVKAQHAEQLATVGLLGASLAHEIRNPLVTIKTFVQLLPKHYGDPVFRDKFFVLIGDEVTRIDRLTEQLLDLASPRAYSAEALELHPVLRSSLELVTAKAEDKQIAFLVEYQAASDRVLTDGSAVKQVLLNLCFNAIQAVEKHDGERWVKVSTRNVPKGLEMTITDSGPGISEDIRPRLFQPFQSTKSSGFGLGLAICRDILAGLDATISVDPKVDGSGACFRVVFPCPA
ncbi:MAG: ATP-binding protein [Opitutus sp.]